MNWKAFATLIAGLFHLRLERELAMDGIFCSALMVCPPSDESCVIGLRHAPGMCKHFGRIYKIISLNAHILTMGNIYEKFVKFVNVS